MTVAPSLPIVLVTLLAAFPSAVAEKERGEPVPLRNTIRWTTASEVDNFGFDVLRATTEKGPFRAVNDKPIAGAGTVDVPTDYVYHDTGIEPGMAYYYYVESISIRGERERVTPTVRASPKWPENGKGSLDRE